ncbi:unnamed protein product [Meloidogyne enterolobii]|uniref:Uncharacterized protein n=1 Tax=Meloidogyne enterolobii TaxID=390850 RepID=A0ACB0YBV0_MELEN
MLQYNNSKNYHRKKRSPSSSERDRRSREQRHAILKALFPDVPMKKINYLETYVTFGLLYLVWIVGRVVEYLYEVRCTLPDLNWLRNVWHFRRAHGQNGGNNEGNNGGNNEQMNEIHQPIQQQIHPQLHPQLHPPIQPHVNPPMQPQNIIHHHPPHHPHQHQPIPWFQHPQHQPAVSYSDDNYPNSPSSSSNTQSVYPSVYHLNQPQDFDADDTESISSDGHSPPSPSYSAQDRKRRSIPLMSQNYKEVKNDDIQQYNSDKNPIINSDSDQNNSKSQDTHLIKGNKKIIEDNPQQQSTGSVIKNFKNY